jgi:hypothetical protein
MTDTWAACGVEFPESFTFPVTVLGPVADLHGAGTFVNSTPTRVDCYVHAEPGQDDPKAPQRLEILTSPLHPELGTELEISFDFAQQLSLALWLFRSAPVSVDSWSSRKALPTVLSLKGKSLDSFLRLARGLLDFHDDRQAYFVARVSPDVLADEEIRMLFVGGHRIDGVWLKARWPLMAATDLYERARRTRERDIAFLFLMMSLEVLFNDGASEVARQIRQRGALLNGRDPGDRKHISESLRRLYGRRSRLVHGDLFEKGSVLAISPEDLSQVTDLVRLSLIVAARASLHRSARASLQCDAGAVDRPRLRARIAR